MNTHNNMILSGWYNPSTGIYRPVGAPKYSVGAPKHSVGEPKRVLSSLNTLKHLSGQFTVQLSDIIKMSAVELADFLKCRLCISPFVMKKLIYEEVDGKAFILMNKANLNFLGLGKNHIMLCLIVPSALFVDDFLEMT